METAIFHSACILILFFGTLIIHTHQYRVWIFILTVFCRHSPSIFALDLKAHANEFFSCFYDLQRHLLTRGSNWELRKSVGKDWERWDGCFLRKNVIRSVKIPPSNIVPSTASEIFLRLMHDKSLRRACKHSSTLSFPPQSCQHFSFSLERKMAAKSVWLCWWQKLLIRFEWIFKIKWFIIELINGSMDSASNLFINL